MTQVKARNIRPGDVVAVHADVTRVVADVEATDWNVVTITFAPVEGDAIVGVGVEFDTPIPVVARGEVSR